MPYSVSSWFIDQVYLFNAEPKRQFLIGTSDYSDTVVRWPKIKTVWDNVKPGNVTLSVANEHLDYNFLRLDKTKLATECFVKLGYTHPTSGDELITVFQGTMDKVRYLKGACTISMLDKFKPLTEKIIGYDDFPVTYTNSTLPSDIAWDAITTYGGYSDVQSTSNPDVDWTSFAEWSAIFSGDSVFMNGHFSDKKVSEILRVLSKQTQSAIFVQEGKIHFKRFTLAGDVCCLINNDSIVDPLQLQVDDETIINMQHVYGDYNVSSDTWGIHVSDIYSASILDYGLREQIEKCECTWYTSSVAALNLSQRILSVSKLPYDEVTAQTALSSIISTIGDIIYLTDSFFGGDIDGSYRLMGLELDLQKGTKKNIANRSQLLNSFTLDFSILDGTDVLA